MAAVDEVELASPDAADEADDDAEALAEDVLEVDVAGSPTLATTLNARRYDGTTQQSYLIFDPAFYPAVPSID